MATRISVEDRQASGEYANKRIFCSCHPDRIWRSVDEFNESHSFVGETRDPKGRVKTKTDEVDKGGAKS